MPLMMRVHNREHIGAALRHFKKLLEQCCQQGRSVLDFLSQLLRGTRIFNGIETLLNLSEQYSPGCRKEPVFAIFRPNIS